MVTRCPICGGRSAEPIYAARRQPALLNTLLDIREAAIDAPTAALDFRGCTRCGFVWNIAFDPTLAAYDRRYVNDQSHSPVFRRHLDRVADRLVEAVSEVDGIIIEIGCGQGSFLRELCRRTGRDGLGFDPAYAPPAGPACDSDDSLVIVPERFSADAARLHVAGRPVAAIVCRHVIEHVADPRMLLCEIAVLMRANPRALLYLETPAFEWIEQQAAFHDLFHEHCSLLSAGTLHELARQGGLHIASLARMFGCQYVAVEIRNGITRSVPTRRCAVDFSSVARRLRSDVSRWRDEIEVLLDQGPLAIWGAGAKGVSFVNHLGLGHDRLPWLIDINPAKQGMFVPVTAQEVISPQRFAERMNGEPCTVIVMNPNYEAEIAATLGTNCTVVTSVSGVMA